MGGMIRAVIADDEPLAREGLRLHLAKEGDVVLAGEAADGRRAVALLASVKPDLLFLDVQMPLLDGFGVVEAIAPECLPTVVFVTAYDRYAMKAFEVHALDYLLKPFTADRFQAAMRKAREDIAARGAHDSRRRLLELIAERAGAAAHLQRFVVRSGEGYRLVPAGEVASFEAQGNYVRLRTGTGHHLLRITMAELEKRLDPKRFARIHRSTMVNIDRIKEITPAWHGDFEVLLQDGQRLRLSRHFRERLLP
ncbi:MAG TPA: LytTR family transcriptional regulator DNA-binding domain-containing protein [Vicinamibacterales bacterium]|nr:LytTR family transcriptional regulator DNA-binding domain-containing protein [Vicinamibacterales bacterium]